MNYLQNYLKTSTNTQLTQLFMSIVHFQKNNKKYVSEYRKKFYDNYIVKVDFHRHISNIINMSVWISYCDYYA